MHKLESESLRLPVSRPLQVPNPPWIWRYGIATTFELIALLSTLLLQHLFPYPFLFLFFGAVMAGAWFGGTGPGLFAVLVSTVVVDYFFVPPFYSFSISTTAEAYFGAFVVCALIASWVTFRRTNRHNTAVPLLFE